MKSLTASEMRSSLEQLDDLLPRELTLIIGGGGAMLLAYSFPLATSDIDAVAKGIPFDELKPLIEKVALARNLPPDWLNPWYSSFTFVLSDDYAERLVLVFKGRLLSVQALGREDLLLMKCFAHRQKDIAHARELIRSGAKTDIVYNRLDELLTKKIPGARAAFEFLEDMIDLEEA